MLLHLFTIQVWFDIEFFFYTYFPVFSTGWWGRWVNYGSRWFFYYVMFWRFSLLLSLYLHEYFFFPGFLYNWTLHFIRAQAVFEIFVSVQLGLIFSHTEKYPDEPPLLNVRRYVSPTTLQPSTMLISTQYCTIFSMDEKDLCVLYCHIFLDIQNQFNKINCSGL